MIGTFEKRAVIIDELPDLCAYLGPAPAFRAAAGAGAALLQAPAQCLVVAAAASAAAARDPRRAGRRPARAAAGPYRHHGRHHQFLAAGGISPGRSLARRAGPARADQPGARQPRCAGRHGRCRGARAMAGVDARGTGMAVRAPSQRCRADRPELGIADRAAARLRDASGRSSSRGWNPSWLPKLPLAGRESCCFIIPWPSMR